jgi:hypothetical protein
MRRFLVLYVGYDDKQYFAEGLIHIDKSVYVRGFLEEGKLFIDIHAVGHYFRDNDDIRSYHIQMIDEVEK